ncbi:MAG: dihydrodipicolinate synthase family protein [Tateyamaria sp.]|jgi:4-hydroxy-tetrahydrodipicolinate synthase|nr:dihydrodipicolinate synthase family protein [Tateyamaria sp.]MDP4065595.1 4-hydroxy-tetrahydrodipicolinate synthase [Rhodobacteraceae bacterium IMCC1923]MDP4068274.1 4-hydroxy-tetrahydrodipicolinate synthase [Rhodobacteraceae bacterium IMCC1933]MDP4071540.1 4-hydroxy-tetrahydrodipicolinate synthase [Rhodobacteraceae bacterium IMCC1909]
MTKAVRGIYAAAVSPFMADGTLDKAKLVAYCQYLTTQGGCDGVAPTGTTGEGNSISFRQKMELAGEFAEAGFDPSKAIFGTGACATQDAIDLSKAALDAGFPNVLVLPPFYYKNVSDEGIYRYFAQLIETIGDDRLRVYLYHFPQMSATPIPVDVAVRLKKDFGPVVAGLKDSSGDMSQALAFADATGGVDADFDVYPSSESFLFEGLARGCAGIISGSTNVFANYVQKGRVDGPDSEAFALVKNARAVASKYPLMAAMKQMEAWRSGDDSWTRMAPPLVPLSAEQKTNLKADIEALKTWVSAEGHE